MSGKIYKKVCPFCNKTNTHRKKDAKECNFCKRYYEPPSSRQQRMYYCDDCNRDHFEHSKIGIEHLASRIGEFK